MIMAVPSATLELDHDSSARTVGNEWSTDFDARGCRTNLASEGQPAQSNADVVLEELFHMTLSSLRGYQELAELTTRPELRSLLEVMPDQTAPLVAPVSSLDEVHEILQNRARHLAEQFGAAIERQKAELEKGVKA